MQTRKALSLFLLSMEPGVIPRRADRAANPSSTSVADYVPYTLPHILLAAIVPAVLLYGARAYALIALFWLAISVLDSAFRSRDARPFRTVQDAAERGDFLWRVLVAAIVPLYFAVLVSGLLFVSTEAGSITEFALATVVVGFVGAIFAMPAAHELMHGRKRWERRLAVVLMTAFSYPHFCIEHTRGHHRNVGTIWDAATARLGEGFYAFFARTLSWSLLDAWSFECERLRRRASVFGPQNRLVRYFIALVALYGAIGIFSGWAGILFFAAQGVIAFSTLEAINYIQHYGLTRGRREDGRLEPVSRRHSWDCHHHLSNWCLFNLPLHADHHAGDLGQDAHKKAHDEAPRLPLGYFVLIWFALIPPLWRLVMDPRIARAAAGEVSIGSASREEWPAI